MRHQNWLLLALGALFLGVFSIPNLGVANSANKWKLVWSDEFNGSKGSSVDPLKWTFDIGGGGWGNGELEYYTDRTRNVFQQDGALVIRAVKETFKEYWDYTSGRILTKGRFEQKYGRFEAKIKIPYGQGIWPAFWLLGADIDKVGWPKCGEIDIMENVGKEPSLIHGTIHGPGYSGGGWRLAPSIPWSKGGWRMIFISTPSNGNPLKSTGTLMISFTKPEPRRNSPTKPAGLSITHFSLS